jgi:hypothetical protein
MLDVGPLLLILLGWILGLAVLYAVIRLAVWHAIEDADRRRNQPTYPAPAAPAAPAARRPEPPSAD